MGTLNTTLKFTLPLLLSACGGLIANPRSTSQLPTVPPSESAIFGESWTPKFVGSHAYGNVHLEGNGESRLPVLSGTGQHFVFSSAATNLVASDSNGMVD